MNRGIKDMDKLRELVRLHRMGCDARKVARTLKMSPNTERTHRLRLQAAGLLEGDPADLPDLDTLAKTTPTASPRPPQETSSVEAWRGRIAQLLADGVGPTTIHERLVEEDPAFRGSVSAVKRLTLHLARARGPRPEDVAIPVETAAGEVAQVDFGYAGIVHDPKSRTKRRAWLFVMVLAHSRHMFCEVVFDQSSATWNQLHVAAFRFFGGVPKAVVPDNLKAAVVKAAFGVDEDVTLNRAFRELARHYEVIIDPTPPRSPEKKGKVERTVQYVKNSFLKGRSFTDVDELNRKLTTWVLERAGQRRHGTTARRPVEHFEAVERAALKPLPVRPFEAVTWRALTVQRDTCVRFDEDRWSVPFRHIGAQVLLRATRTSVELYVEDRRVATHDRTTPGPHIEDAHLPEGRRELRHRGREHWEARADAIDVETVGAYVRAVLDQDDVQQPLRRAASVLRALEAVPRDRAIRACARAAFHGVYRAETIRNILDGGLEAQPLPTSGPLSPAFAPRFAREATSFLSTPGVAHGTC